MTNTWLKNYSIAGWSVTDMPGVTLAEGGSTQDAGVQEAQGCWEAGEALLHQIVGAPVWQMTGVCSGTHSQTKELMLVMTMGGTPSKASTLPRYHNHCRDLI
jgi:hypothetical protein